MSKKILIEAIIENDIEKIKYCLSKKLNINYKLNALNLSIGSIDPNSDPESLETKIQFIHNLLKLKAEPINEYKNNTLAIAFQKMIDMKNNDQMFNLIIELINHCVILSDDIYSMIFRINDHNIIDSFFREIFNNIQCESVSIKVIGKLIEHGDLDLIRLAFNQNDNNKIKPNFIGSNELIENAFYTCNPKIVRTVILRTGTYSKKSTKFFSEIYQKLISIHDTLTSSELIDLLMCSGYRVDPMLYLELKNLTINYGVNEIQSKIMLCYEIYEMHKIILPQDAYFLSQRSINRHNHRKILKESLICTMNGLAEWETNEHMKKLQSINDSLQLIPCFYHPLIALVLGYECEKVDMNLPRGKILMIDWNKLNIDNFDFYLIHNNI